LENLEVCRKCGGFCCKQSGGLVFPADLAFTHESSIYTFLKENLHIGKYSVDVLMDDPSGISGYYIRMRQLTDSGNFNPGNKGQCSFLNDDGCSFDYQNRPKGCRDLIPSPPECYFSDGMAITKCVEAWKPHYDIIEALIRDSQSPSI
jgi:Fe-S-cluster containining protein